MACKRLFESSSPGSQQANSSARRAAAARLQATLAEQLDAAMKDVALHLSLHTGRLHIKTFVALALLATRVKARGVPDTTPGLQEVAMGFLLARGPHPPDFGDLTAAGQAALDATFKAILAMDQMPYGTEPVAVGGQLMELLQRGHDLLLPTALHMGAAAGNTDSPGTAGAHTVATYGAPAAAHSTGAEADVAAETKEVEQTPEKQPKAVEHS
jgi:hypothetical protein